MPILDVSTCRDSTRLLVTDGFEYTRTALCMPSFDIAFEFVALFKDLIVPLLVLDRICQAIAMHAFCKMLELVRGIV